MTTNSISIRFNSKWCIDFAPHYIFSDKGELYNMQRGKMITKVVKGYTIGYNIGGKFYSLTALRKHIKKIERVIYPF